MLGGSIGRAEIFRAGDAARLEDAGFSRHHEPISNPAADDTVSVNNPTMNSKIQFLIVNYRTANLAVRCAKSITGLGVAEQDIIIVDNLSRDNSVEIISSAVPDAAVIQSDRNGGFGAGVNLGMQFASAKYVIVLNPDTIFIEDFLDRLIGVFESDRSIAVIGLNLLNTDRTPQYSARRFYSLLDVAVRRTALKTIWPCRLLNDRHLMKKSHLAASAVFDADWVMGTGFAIRKSVFESIRGMDEGYFLYLEDVDLCARVWKAGYRVVCMPAASIIHDHQRASANSLLSNASKHHLLSLRRFAKKFRLPFFYMPRREYIFGRR